MRRPASLPAEEFNSSFLSLRKLYCSNALRQLLSLDAKAFCLSNSVRSNQNQALNVCCQTPAKMYDIDMDIRLNNCLRSYRELVAQVDRMLDGVRSRYPADIFCRKGCDCGCRNLSIFPVEALSVFIALQELPANTAAAIRQRAQADTFWNCPLLKERACGLYPFRPIICRTHGFPLQTIYNGQPSIGYCRHNFKDKSGVPQDAITDLDRINCSLRAINTAFIRRVNVQLPVRLSIAAAVLLDRLPS